MVGARDCHQRLLCGPMASVLLLLQDVNNPPESHSAASSMQWFTQLELFKCP